MIVHWHTFITLLNRRSHSNVLDISGLIKPVILLVYIYSLWDQVELQINDEKKFPSLMIWHAFMKFEIIYMYSSIKIDYVSAMLYFQYFFSTLPFDVEIKWLVVYC